MSNSKTIEDRRKQVMTLLSKCVNEDQIAKQLGVDQSTISRDIKALKAAAQSYVYDLAKSNLAYEYVKTINGLDEVKKEAWRMYSDSINTKVKLGALREIRECENAAFNLFNQGVSIMNIKALEDRVNKIESLSRSRQRQIS
jgi:DNA-binding transcriptional ArsR family regulator